jgi:uncharacterized protein (DUF486 family)
MPLSGPKTAEKVFFQTRFSVSLPVSARHPFFLLKDSPMTWPMLTPILLLCVSNVFMTFAWYGQLKFPNTALLILIPVSWGIAFFEYCFAVPANHLGARVYSPAQLKTIQEIITLCVFAIFSITYLGESLRWNHLAAFVCLVGAAFFVFNKWN